MPAAPTRRQPDSSAIAWFEHGPHLDLVQEVQRQVVPELTRVFGQSGLYLRPSAAVAPVLSGNMLAGVVSLYRDGGGFAGDLRCVDAALPLAGGSLSLVYALFAFEASPAPAELMEEIARVLKPDGVALVVGMNPYAPARLRWAFRGFASHGRAGMAAQLQAAGLEVQRARYVGPRWSVPPGYDPGARGDGGPLASLRMAHLLVARRRDPGLTPLRTGAPVLGLRPGMNPG